MNLSAQTAQFSNGLKKANGDLKTFEKQASRTQRMMAGFSKGFATIGGKIGLGGVFGGAFGGFQFARFAKDSLREHAKDNRELKATLDDLDASFVQIKKNFGAWLVDVGGANTILQQFIANLAKMSGEDINARQALVNTGRLDTNQSGAELQSSLDEAINARKQLEAQFDPTVANLDLKRQFDLITAEITILERRLADVKASGLDTSGVTSGFGTFLFAEMEKGISKVTPLAEGLGDTFMDAFKGAGEQLVKFDSLMQKAEEQLQDFMAGFQVNQAHMGPIAMFKKETEELQRLFDKGFINDDAFNLALFDERQRLEQFAGLNDPIPARVGGARRGSAEAFEKVAAFQDGSGNVVQRTLQESLDVLKEQLRLQKEAAARNRAELDAVGTIDTKP